jgi:hypothetical protein
VSTQKAPGERTPARKSTGLASYEPAATPTVRALQRKKGKRDTVGITLRLTVLQWTRIHELARDEGVSLQELGITGISRLFEEKGLPPL